MKGNNERVTMLHGAGGTVMHDLVKNYIVIHFKNIDNVDNAEVPLEAMDDAAAIGNIVLKSDSHAVKPLFFPGGNIGHIAISGTVNDIAALGAEPYALACGLILEEGFALSDFEKILISMRKMCTKARVGIITGDTKVVERGTLGGCVMNVSGIGRRTEATENNLQIVRRFQKDFSQRWLLDSNLRVGNKIILSGTIGDHGVAILSAQQGLKFGSKIESDVRPLNILIQKLLGKIGGIVSIKDPTRGGLAECLNEFSEKSKVGILIHEDKVPIREDVKAACEMLGLDPLEIGNEGKIAIGVVEEKADQLLQLLKSTDEGKDANIIGEVTEEFNGVGMETTVGGNRIIARPIGDPVPRIC
ncbi:hydrogenase expression/formation protein HypE [Candidatus Bathyarchaeota archaeon]|nr:hydrogenase expression/formation protein HypE [Candidatus Bathyarchaeota archaeon]